jgi:putative transposase
MTEALAAARGGLGIATTSGALGIARSTAYRWMRPAPASRAAKEREPSPRALVTSEQDLVLEQLRSERFVDKAPAVVHATLLEEGVFLCSERTMYRILAEKREVRERRAQRVHPRCAAPVLVATKPNQVWSWDVTELRGPVKGESYPLYVVLDLFSRYVVAWLLAHRESAALAKRLIRAACERHGILPGQLTTHSDRGSIQTATDLDRLYEDLGIIRSLSRPRVSNDNPYSESQFKTTKYWADYPERFEGFRHANSWCAAFFPKYNFEHRHSGIAYLPRQRCTSARRLNSSPGGSRPWTRLTVVTRSGSSRDRRGFSSYPEKCGSTERRTRQRTSWAPDSAR